MKIQRRKRTAQIAILVLAPLTGILVASCGGGDATGSQSALDSREFLSVVQEARDAGLTPYWLGQEFQAASSTVELVADAKFYGPEQPMLSIMYRMAQPAAGRISLLVYSKAHGGWETYLEGAGRNPNTVIEDTTIGPWPAELWRVPTASRPVNAAIFVIALDDMVVIATAKAATSGVPGEDVNPLIDSELLKSVLEQHLRPYPE